MIRLITLVLLPIIIQAEEVDETTSQTESASSPEIEIANESAASEQLRSRELSDAFKNFRPSEEITADNAVSFPVDI